MKTSERITKCIRIMFHENSEDRNQRILKRLRDDQSKDHHVPGSLTHLGRCAVDHSAADVIQQLERERDAAVEDLKGASACFACKHFKRNSGNCFGGCTCLHNIQMAELAGVEYTGVSFEWRGVQEAET